MLQAQVLFPLLWIRDILIISYQIRDILISCQDDNVVIRQSFIQLQCSYKVFQERTGSQDLRIREY